jgi:RNase P protein component
VKRRLRAIVASLPVQAGWDVVMNARSGAGTAGYAALRGAVSGLLERAGALKKASET